MADLIMKQARAIIDERTTVVCLDIHGIVMPVDQPFETLAGDFMQPPFHVHCRTLVGPHMAGFIAEARREANKELKTRSPRERRRGPDGPTGQIPGPVTGNPPSGFSRRDEEAEFKLPGAKTEKFTQAKPAATTGPEENRVREIETDLDHAPGWLDDPENVRRTIEDLNELLDDEYDPQLVKDRDLLVRWLASPSKVTEPALPKKVVQEFAAGAARDTDAHRAMMDVAVEPAGRVQELAISDYLFNSFEFNRSLRENNWDRPSDKRRVEGLDALIDAQLPLKQDMVAYRGMPASAAAFDSYDGREITDLAYLSTAPEKGLAEDFARKGIDDSGTGILLEILIPKGTKGVSAHHAMMLEPDEYEVDEENPFGALVMANELILPRGTTLRFVGEPVEHQIPGTTVRKIRAVVVSSGA